MPFRSVRQACPRWLILRMASLFGKARARGKGENFVETILAKARSGEPLRVVKDIHMSPHLRCRLSVGAAPETRSHWPFPPHQRLHLYVV